MLRNYFYMFLASLMCIYGFVPAFAENSIELEAGPGIGLAGTRNSMRYEFQIETEIAPQWDIDFLHRIAKPNGQSDWEQKSEFGLTREFDHFFFRAAVGHMSDLDKSYNFYNLQPGVKIPLASKWNLKLAYRYIHSLPSESIVAHAQTYRSSLEYQMNKDITLKLKWDHELSEMNEFSLGFAYSW